MSLPGQSGRYLNPVSGSMLKVEAGSAIEIAFEFTNDAPNPQSFYLEIEGLPAPEWSSGTGPNHAVVAAAFGVGTLAGSICPPARALPGEYSATARVICDGAVVEPPGDVTLSVLVEPGPELPEPEPPDDETAVVEPAPESSLAEPAETSSAESESESVADTEPVTPIYETPAAAEPQPVPTPEPAPATEPPAPKPKPTPRRAEGQPVTPPAGTGEAEPAPARVPPKPAATPARPAKPASDGPVARPASPPSPKPAEPAAPAAAAQTSAPVRPKTAESRDDDQMPVIDLDTSRRRAGAAQEEDEDQEPEVKEPSILDPRDETVLSLKPGETLLLRFSFRNDQRGTRTYVVDEDRALEPGWIVLVQDQVNINANGTGEVSVRLAPPITAAPGTYPFIVRTGPLGASLTPCSLMLEVRPTPAVKLSSKQPVVKSGPFGRAVDFELTAESAGNADTSFRVAVRDPSIETDEQGMPRGPDEVYESPQWRYLFDKEFETLASKAAGRPPSPVSLKLRLLRKGIWWFGFKEVHKARVKAVPVTDPSNGAKKGNAIDLTAIRWRLLPLPGFLAGPLAVLLFLLLASGASELKVTNAYGVGRSFYVLQMRDENWTEGKPLVNLQARLRWNAPWYALIKLKATEENRTDTHLFVRGRYEDTVPVEEYGDRRRRSYEVGSIIRPGADPVLVRFVPLRTDMKLLITVGPRMAPVDEYERDEEIGDEKIPLKSREVTIDVPLDGSTRVNFSNLTDANRGLKILMWPVTIPSNFNIVNFNRTDSTQIDAGATHTAKITFVGDVPQDGSVVEEDWQFVTTDATHQVLHVRLRLKVD